MLARLQTLAILVLLTACSSDDDVRVTDFDGVYQGPAVSFIIDDGVVGSFTIDLSCEFEPGSTSRAQGESPKTTLVNFRGAFWLSDASVPWSIEATVIDDPATGRRVDGTYDYLTCTDVPFRSTLVDEGP